MRLGVFARAILFLSIALLLGACCTVPCDYLPPDPVTRKGVSMIQRNGETVGYETSTEDPAMSWRLLRHDLSASLDLGSGDWVRFDFVSDLAVPPEELCNSHWAELSDSGNLPSPKLWSVHALYSEEPMECAGPPQE